MDTLALFHISNSYNYGSAMMGINFINYISKKENFAYITDARTEEDLIRYKKELDSVEIGKIGIYQEKKGRFFFNRVLNMLNRINFIVKELEQNDPSAVIILGGDDLSETYTGAGIISELLKIYQIARRYPVFLAFQTIGPFTSWRRPVSKYILNKCYIYTRDDLTYNYLQNELKIDKVYRSSDLAFLDLPHQSLEGKYGVLAEKYGLVNDGYITVVPSGLVSHYTMNEDDYIDSWVKILEKMPQMNDLKNLKIVLLSHVLRPEKVDDRIVIEKIRKKVRQEYREKMVFIVDELLPSEARLILGNGLFTITGRMHAAVSTLQMGKPAVALSYSKKYDGVIGEMMSLPQLIIKADLEEVWRSGQIVEQVLERAKYVLENYNTLKESIFENLKDNQLLVNESLTSIFNQVTREKNGEHKHSR